jgi:hypothetical protein
LSAPICEICGKRVAFLNNTSPKITPVIIYFSSQYALKYLERAMKIILSVILFSCAAMAQNDAAIEKAKFACGPGQVHFDVEAINYTDSVTQPPSGKALVYVIAEGQITARIGLNGTWAGAVEGNSHLSFPVDPGEHHLCASWQSVFIKANKLVALSSFTAEAGKVYYFRVRATIQAQNAPALLDMDPINSDQGSYMVLKSKVSESHVKK